MQSETQTRNEKGFINGLGNLLGTARVSRERIRELCSSPASIIAFVFIVAWLSAGVFFAREDIKTTIEGYAALPTNEAFPDTATWVGVFLFVGPVVMTVMYNVFGQKGWLKTSIALLAVDILLDMIYRVESGLVFESWSLFAASFFPWLLESVIALLQGIFIFTLGSEVAIAYGSILVLMMLPYVITHLAIIASDMFRLVGTGWERLDTLAESLRDDFLSDPSASTD